ncbi:MAG: U32 family peptidase C-terminal domain-containing protein [Cyanobacteria bacterium P01_H01_bin.74]
MIENTFQSAKKPELLLPAGSPEKLLYAMAYGADAVYMGLPMASLRTPGRGDQFSQKNLAHYVHLAQDQGVKVYITINIFPSNPDLKRIIPHLEQLQDIQPNAIIFTDTGTYRLAKQYAPDIPLHLSTQANTLNTEACAFWQDMGVQRVILAREVPYREIVEIHEALPTLELECFIHGSICVAYSGRCVISDYLTDNTKNSNKGMCGNSCRWSFVSTDDSSPQSQSIRSEKSAAIYPGPGGLNTETHYESENVDLKHITMAEAFRPDEPYTFEEDDKGSYMLNSKDLCLIRHLHELQQAGICSFKIEGRTKSVFYAATTARVYRQAIDILCGNAQNHLSVDEIQLTQWVAELAEAGNRGFTEGFYNGRPDGTAYNYQDTESQQTSRFLALTAMKEGFTIPEDTVNQNTPLVYFVVKNPFQVGDTIDWVTPQGIFSFELTRLLNQDGFPLYQAKTNHKVAIPLPERIYQALFEKQWPINPAIYKEKLQWSILKMPIFSQPMSGSKKQPQLV